MFRLCLASLFAALVNAGNAAPPATGASKEPTEAQIAEYMRDFEEFDSNKDGYLDTQEVRGNFKGDVSDPELWDFYRMADKSYDGKVSKQEYIKYAADLSYQPETAVKEETAGTAVKEET